MRRRTQVRPRIAHNRFTQLVGGPEDGDIEVTAVFEPDALYALTLLEDGEGTAEASPPLHTEGYGLGESIVLEATPDLGWAFDHWLDNTTGNVVTYQSTYEVRAKETNSYTAVFRALNSLTLTTVGQGYVHRMTNSLIYEEDASVTLTPVPNPGWKFTGWTGDATGMDNPLQLTMDCPKEITATFAPDRSGAGGIGRLHFTPSCSARSGRWLFTASIASSNGLCWRAKSHEKRRHHVLKRDK